MTPELQALATLDRTIHEPARLMIMTVLYAVNEADFLSVSYTHLTLPTNREV